MRKSAVYVGLVLTFLWCMASVSQAATIAVAAGATAGSDNGCSLADAINAANTNTNVGACTLTGTPGGGGDGYSSGNVIELAAGNYTFTAADNDQQGANALPAITGNVVIVGDSSGSVITRAGGAPAFRFFFVASGATLTLKNLTVTNGQIQGGGEGGDPGHGPPGGGASPAEGGAVYNQGSLTLDSVTFTGNDAIGGGAGAYGGALFNDGGAISVVNSTFANNSALDSDGGVGNGGALFNQSGNLDVRFATLAGNTADAGGAVYNAGGATVDSSILAGSTNGSGAGASDCESGGAPFISGYDVVQQPGSCPFNNNDQTADPQLATNSPANNGGPTPTFALQSGSPAINHGDTVNAPATDQRGDQRDSQPDVGSFEYIGGPQISGLPDTVTVTEGESVSPVSFTLSGGAPLTVTATSSNTTLLPASGVTISSGCGSDSNHYDCTLNLAPAANQTGSSTVTVKVTDTYGGHDQQSLTFTVNAPAAAAIALSPGSLNFGSVAVGATETRTETLSNTGTGTLSIQGITIVGGDGSFEISRNRCGTSLDPGKNCLIDVRFAPTAASAYSASLEISSNAAGSPSQAALTGTGVAQAGGNPAVSLSPTSIDYGAVTVGHTLTRTETLTNTGDATLTIGGQQIVGDGAAAFHITAGNCNGSLAAGQSCALQVEFAPTAAASYSAALQITSNASSSPDQVALSGTGTNATTPAPVVSLSAGSLDFGSVAVGTSATRTETLTNSGNATLSINGITIAGDASDIFQIAANNCGSSLAAAKSCTIEVAFAPAATTTYTGTLTISSNASSSPDDVGLAGTGTSSGGGGGGSGPPTAIAAGYTLSANHTFSGQLQGSAASGATLTYAVVTQPAHGQLKVDAATGAFVYTPAHNFIGSDGFAFDVSDGTSTSAPANISLTVVRGDLTVKNGGGGALGVWALALLGLIAAATLLRRHGQARCVVVLTSAVIAFSACCVPAPARAADPGWYAGLQLNLIKPDNGRVASTSGFSGRTLTFGRYFGDHFALEIQRAYHSDHPRSLYGIANWVTWGVNALWYPRMSSDAIAPFIFAGAGHEFEYRGDGSQPSTSYANIGFGVTRQIGTSPFRIRVDVQTQHAFSGGFNDFAGSLGVTYSF